MPDIAEFRRGLGEIKRLNCIVKVMFCFLATRRRCCSTFALLSGNSGRTRSAHELRRSNRSVSDRGAQADFSVTPRLDPITVPCLEPPPVRLTPECSEVKVKGAVRKEAETRDSGQFGDIWAHVFQVWVGCSRRGSGSGGFTRMGRDHGLSRSSPAGLLPPHGQSQTLGGTSTLSPEVSSQRLQELFIIQPCASGFYWNQKSTLSQ